MTDNDIIKALECCGLDECKGCPFYTEELGCDANIHLYALDLITRQKAEIERLEKGELSKAMTFNSKTISNAVNEEIKEFAERLKANLDISVCGYGREEVEWGVLDTIDRLIKEMTGGEG